MGAGTGHRALLNGLIKYREELKSLTAIVAVTDNGGHSGELRKQHSIPAVGDGRQCLTALAGDRAAAARFDKRDADGRSHGNAELVRLVQEQGSLSKAFAVAAEQLRCFGAVVPATNAGVHVAAELTDGSLIVGEWEIVERQPATPIASVRLEPSAPAHPDALAAISKSDVIIIAPGGFYVGVVSTLLPDGMAEAISRSRAPLVQVVNFMNFPSLTDSWTAKQHIDEMSRYTHRRPDLAIINSGFVPEHIQTHYHKFGYTQVQVPTHDDPVNDTRLVITDLVPEEIPASGERPGNFKKATHLLVHDPKKTVQAITTALIEFRP